MLTYNNQFHIELKKILDEEIEKLVEQITNKLSVSDFANYTYIVGKINALREVYGYCEEVNTILSKR
jgi:hypothetical protein